MRLRVLTGDSAWQPLARKEENHAPGDGWPPVAWQDRLADERPIRHDRLQCLVGRPTQAHKRSAGRRHWLWRESDPDGLRPLHGDIGGQKGVGAADPGDFTALQFRIEVDHLHDPVHTGIGSPGAHRRYGLRGKTGQGMLQLVLNGLA